MPISCFQKIKDFVNKNCETSYNIVSLGPNCYPKTILTRKKLKKTKSQGELTMPFDLAWYHKAEFITEFIKNDFSNFFEDMNFSQNANSWDASYKINFSHEKKFGPAEKDLLITMYNKRISNFREVLNSRKPVIFLQILKNKTIGEDVNNLYEVLKNKRQNRPFILVVIDTEDIIADDLNPAIKILKLHKKLDNETIYTPEFYLSRDGKVFENTIISFIKLEITKSFNCKPHKFL